MPSLLKIPPFIMHWLFNQISTYLECGFQIGRFQQNNNQKMSRITKPIYQFEQPKSTKIWEDSPCTISFIGKLPYIEKANRFEYNSIYYKDDPFKPARKIDEFQKPDLLLLEFRRNIRDAEKLQNYGSRRNSSIRPSYNHNEDGSINNVVKQHTIVERLYPKKVKPIKLQYDLHGNRSSFYDEEQKSPKKQKPVSKKLDSFFTESDRIDMSRPENFNPGPGSYFNGAYNNSISLSSNLSRDNLSKCSGQTKSLHRKNLSSVVARKMQPANQILTN